VKRASPFGGKAIPHGTSRFVAITLVSTSTGPVFAGSSSVFSGAEVFSVASGTDPSAAVVSPSARVVCDAEPCVVVGSSDAWFSFVVQEAQNAKTIKTSIVYRRNLVEVRFVNAPSFSEGSHRGPRDYSPSFVQFVNHMRNVRGRKKADSPVRGVGEYT
jgi:hypothetical protein